MLACAGTHIVVAGGSDELLAPLGERNNLLLPGTTGEVIFSPVRWRSACASGRGSAAGRRGNCRRWRAADYPPRAADDRADGRFHRCAWRGSYRHQRSGPAGVRGDFCTRKTAQDHRVIDTILWPAPAFAPAVDVALASRGRAALRHADDGCQTHRVIPLHILPFANDVVTGANLPWGTRRERTIPRVIPLCGGGDLRLRCPAACRFPWGQGDAGERLATDQRRRTDEPRHDPRRGARRRPGYI